MSTFSALVPEALVKSKLVLSSLIILAACATDAPRVELLGPDGPILAGDSLTVRFRAAGIAIVGATGTATAGEAHHHLFIDRDPTPEGEVIPKADGIVHLGTGADSLRLALPVGTHRLIAVLASGDHVPVAGAARDTLEVVITPRP